MREAVVIAAVGTWFLASISIAWVMIRRRQVAKHREWMIRAVATSLSVSTVRLVSGPIDFMLTPRGVSMESVLVTAFVTGWGITLLAAEWWVRRTRPAGGAFRVPATEV